MDRFQDNFDQNLEKIRAIFDQQDTFRVRLIKNRAHPEVRMAACFMESMINSESLSRDVAAPLTERDFDPAARPLSKELAAAVLAASSQDFTDEVKKTVVQISAGDCAIFCEGCAEVIILDIKGMPQRGIEQPDGEVSVAGPHEGFNENIMHNLALIQKRLCCPDLKAEFVKVGSRSNTNVAVCYIKGIADPETARRVKQRVENISIDGVWDGNYLLEMFAGGQSMLFPRVGKTQRPDVVCDKLCEGRVALIVNGAPAALTLPFIFTENFQVADDYYLSHPYANVGRMLRIIGFFLAVLAPAIYLALIVHHPMMLPSELLLGLTAAREGIPISSLLEMLVLFSVFEILRETGSRMPESIGLALNIVGAIVLGQAAVDAGFFSAPMVIIVAFSGTLGLMVRELRGTVFFLRFGYIFAAAWLGLFGVAALTGVLWCYLHSLHTWGVPYLYTFSPLYKNAEQDAFWRGKIPLMNYRWRRFSDNAKRQGKV